MKPFLLAAALAAALAAGASAQTPSMGVRHAPVHAVPTPAGPAGRHMSTTPTIGAIKTTERTAISKACSAQADAKGLHKKARDAFRRGCMKG